MEGGGAQGVSTDPHTCIPAADEQAGVDWPFPPLQAGHGIEREEKQMGGSGTVSGYGGEPTGEPPPSARDEVSVMNGPAARLDPGAAAFAPREVGMTSESHGDGEARTISASTVGLNPAAVAFVPRGGAVESVPRGGVSSVGGPMCPDDHWYCSDGTRAARQVRSNADRYTYQCNVCLRHFDQRRPNLVRQDESRDPRWRDDIDRNPHSVTETCTPCMQPTQPTVSPATQQRQRHGRRHKPPLWPLRPGNTQGELRFGFHNSSGQRTDDTARRKWISALMHQFDVVGTCELNADAVVRADMAQAERERDGYRAWFAPGTTKQTGVALLISNRLAHAKVEVTYRDPTGHTLIANVDILGRLHLQLVISHAPADSSDTLRAAYFTQVLCNIPTQDANQPERMGMWMGDFNFEEPCAATQQTIRTSLGHSTGGYATILRTRLHGSRF